jgi:hypothetical protein
MKIDRVDRKGALRKREDAGCKVAKLGRNGGQSQGNGVQEQSDARSKLGRGRSLEPEGKSTGLK